MKLICTSVKKIFDADNYGSKLLIVKITSKQNMSMLLFLVLKVILLSAIISLSFCNEEEVPKNTIILGTTQNFRKLVEETSTDNSSNKENPDSNNRLVSFLVQNAKQLFSNSKEPTVILNPDSDNDESTVVLAPSTTTIIATQKKKAYDKSTADTISNLEDFGDKKLDSTFPYIYIKKETDDALNITDRSYNLSSTPTTLSRTAKIFDKQSTTEYNSTDEVLILEKKAIEEMHQQALQSVDESKTSMESSKRSCIACDNVVSKDCYDPKNKLISSRVCNRDEDLCYSMHTPFGIVDRGCFNVNHNLTTYVCSCNLCNYISISEMPYIFTGKQDWVENVKELSRTKGLRKSIFKDMSCLRCEVNATLKTEDMMDNANCLQGNINKLPMQECASNEICGVRAIKSESYIWRGCLSRPLYNYWLALCDSDLCNYDSFVSIYDVDF